MADVKISGLTVAGALAGTELVEIVQGGGSVRTTTQAIADLGGGGGISNVVEDTTPQLGGNLDPNGNTIDLAFGDPAVLARFNDGVGFVDWLWVSEGDEVNVDGGTSASVKLNGTSIALNSASVTLGNGGTAAIILPVGSTAQRPTGANGRFRYNSDNHKFEGYANGSWVDFNQTVTESIVVAVSDETTDLTTGTGKLTFRMPYGFTLTEVRASVTTAPTGANLIVDINEGGVSILSTKLSIDAGEKTSTTAATAAVISDSALADDAEITIDIDQIGSTVAGAGLKVTLIGNQ